MIIPLRFCSFFLQKRLSKKPRFHQAALFPFPTSVLGYGHSISLACFKLIRSPFKKGTTKASVNPFLRTMA